MGTQGVGTFQINSKFASGNLVFYEKAVGRTATGDVLTIGTTAVNVGGTSQAVDFGWYATGSASVVISASGTSLTLAGVNMATDAPVVITDSTASTTTGTGALIVSGGVGIAKGLFVGEVVSVGTVCQPDANGGAALGTTALQWSNLFLYTGGVVNFSNGNMTITHSAAVLTVAGGTTAYSDTTDSTSGTSGAINTLGGIGVTKAIWAGTTITSIGGLVIAPTAIGTKLDFALETEWVSGTLINADFASSTTLTGAVVGMNLDFGANVVATSEQSVKALDINLPQMTVDAASPTVKGIEITATGAVVQTTSGTTTWTGLDITLPAITQTAGTVNTFGIKITSGAITSGTQIGLQVGVDDLGADVYFYGATAATYLQWDESADSLLLVGATSLLNVAGTTASTTTSTGAIVTAGGLGVAGAAYIGGRLDVTATGVHATTGRVGKFTATVATPNQGDGYGVFEVDVTASGNFAGTTAAFSSWLNLATGASVGANMICSQNNGIYIPTGTTATSAKAIMGMRMHYVDDDGDNPGSLYCFSTNIYSNVLTAIFDVNAAIDLNWATAGWTGGAGHIPLFRDASAGVTYYVNVYTAAS